MSKSISIEITEDEALVLFELLEREFDLPNYGKFKEVTSSEAEIWALNGVRCALQRAVAVPFNSDYDVLLAKASEALVEFYGPDLPGLES